MHKRHKLQNRIPLVVAAILLFVAIMVEIGWAINSQYLKSVIPGMLSMNPITAVGFMLSAAALTALVSGKTRLALIASVLMLAIGAIKLLAIISGVDIPVDQWLFTEKLVNNGNFLPSRIAPNAALNFAVVGLAATLLIRPTQRRIVAAQCLSFISLLLTLSALTGYLYGIKSLYGVGDFIPMALHTSMCFLLLNSSLLALRFKDGITGSVFYGQSRHSRQSRYAVIAVFVTLPLLFIGVNLVSLHGTRVFSESRREVDQSFGVVIAAEKALASLEDAETGQRGYLLTGEERYLLPYNNATIQVPVSLAELRKLATHRLEEVDRLDKLSQDKFSELALTIGLKRQGRSQDALAIVLTDRGRNTMMEFRRVVADIESSERISLTRSKQRESLAEKETVTALAAGTLLTLALIVIVGTLLLRDARLRTRERHEIEKQVVQRTNQLNIEHARLTASIESLTFGFLIVNENSAVMALNKTACKMLGVGQQSDFSNIEKSLGGAMDLRSNIEKAMRTSKSVQLKDVFFNNQFLAVLISPVLSMNTLKGAVITLSDVTEQRALDRSRDEFFSIASHELRTPLTAIRGTTSMMLDMYAEQLSDPDLHEMIQDMHGASIRLIDTVNTFLDTSTLEQGKRAFKTEPVKLQQVVEASVQATHTLAQNGVDLQVHVPKSLPLVQVDVPALTQVINILLSNAYKFTTDGTITVSAHVKAGHIVLEVADTGKGIPEDRQYLLFRKFQQASQNILTRDGTHSIGLGLYVARLLCEGMHCKIQLKSSLPGKGATFTVKIPTAS